MGWAVTSPRAVRIQASLPFSFMKRPGSGQLWGPARITPESYPFGSHLSVEVALASEPAAAVSWRGCTTRNFQDSTHQGMKSVTE